MKEGSHRSSFNYISKGFTKILLLHRCLLILPCLPRSRRNYFNNLRWRDWILTSPHIILVQRTEFPSFEFPFTTRSVNKHTGRGIIKKSKKRKAFRFEERSWRAWNAREDRGCGTFLLAIVGWTARWKHNTSQPAQVHTESLPTWKVGGPTWLRGAAHHVYLNLRLTIRPISFNARKNSGRGSERCFHASLQKFLTR